jgi:hypothetical protein
MNDSILYKKCIYIVNKMLIINSHMGQRGRETEVSEQATCEVCGLTARTKDELKIHVERAHGTTNSNKVSSEQKIDPFP